jgi:Calcineurin-like phosphoesterase
VLDLPCYKMRLRRHPLLTLYALAGCQAAQLQAPAPIEAPLRELPWGQLNFLHTTDTHGWHAGHLQEPQYGADWGDYISFAQHMRAKADADGTDLLLVDTGDRVDGNGLYDASEPKGKFTRDIFARQDIDIVTVGNHELYLANTSALEYDDLVPRFRGNYLASNLDYIRPDGRQVPMAQRYKKFTTKNQGIRIVAFGFVYDFHRNSNVTIVTDVEDVVKSDWFRDAISDRDVDLFVVAGHVWLDQLEYKLVYETIRKEQWDTPIQFFAGHAHRRGYKVFDKRAHAIASGRYFETVGFQSVSGLSTGKDAATAASVSFGRRYIDNNLFSYYHHSGKNSSTFPTEAGEITTAQIAAAREHLGLNKTFGCTPRTLWTNRAPYPHQDSIFSWLDSRVIPETAIDEGRADKPRILIGNTGVMRFDLFKGPFTRDTTYMLSPFPGVFRVIEDVPYEYADRVAEHLNKQKQILGRADNGLQPPLYAQHPGIAESPFEFVNPERSQTTFKDKDDLIPGYTTKDDLGDDGDDTVHAPMQFYSVPKVFESRVNTTLKESDDDDDERPVEKVDLVYLDYIEQFVLNALNFLGASYKEKDTRVYVDKSVNELITEWVEKNWKC